MMPLPPLPLAPDSISALVIVDMQVYFFRKPERRLGLEAVVDNINRLTAHFDRRGWPVVHAITAYRPDGSNWDLRMKTAGKPELLEGADETRMLPAICYLPTHRVVNKTRYSAFFKTGLAEQLSAAGVQRVIVTGAYTHYCVNATVFDAYAHDFVPGIVTDAVISHLGEESALMIQRMKRNGYHLFTTGEFLAG